MKADWLCKLGGQVRGPFSVEQLRQMASSGAIDAVTEIRREKDPRWFPAGKVPGLLPTSAATARVEKLVTPSMAASGNQVPTARPAPARIKPAAESASAAGKPKAAAVAVGVPVGQAVAPISPSPTPQIFAANSPAGFEFVSTSKPSNPSAKSNSKNPKQRPKSNRAFIVVASLAGTCLLLVVVGGMLLALGSADSTAAVAQAQPNDAGGNAGEVSSASESHRDQAEINPLDEVDRVGQSDAEGEGSEVGPAPTARRAESPSSGKTVDVLRQIKAWNSLSGNRVQFGLKNIARFEVVSVWLATDATGRPASLKPLIKANSPAAIPEVSKAPPSAGAAESSTVEIAKFVFVDLKITNTGSGPVQYRGWNASADTTALMVDSAGNPLGLVPATETPGVTRLGITSIPADRSVSDTIVFRAPADSPSMLRLALPKTALSPLAKGYFAIEAPAQSLRRKAGAPGSSDLASNVATSGSGDGAQSEFADLQRQIMEGETSDAQAQPGATPAPSGAPAATVGQGENAARESVSGKPPTAEEFDKLLREMAEEEAGKDAETMPAEGAEAAGK